MKKVLLILPAYNEEECILKTYSDVREYCKKYNKKYDIIVINDGSTDKTGLICKKNSIPCISLIQNLGIGGAVQTGYKFALENNYDFAVQFDSDGQHDIAYVEDLIHPLVNEECDMVIGSRFIGTFSSFRSTFMRRVGINIISCFIKVFTGKKIYDTTSGFRAINRRLIKLYAKNYPTEYPESISSVVAIKKSFKIKEIPVRMLERQGGVSSIGGKRNFSLKTFYFMFNVCMSIVVASMRRYK